MAKRAFAALGMIVAVLSPLTAGAAGERPSVEYSADQSIESAAAAMKSKIFSTPTRERREMSQGGAKMIMITRLDKKVIWTLMPEEKMYIEMPMKETAEKTDMSAYKIEQTPLGQETIEGQSLNKSKIIMTHSSGSKMGGFMWTTREGILVKMDAIAVDKGSKDRFKMEQTNIKVGKQPAELFEIPKGFQTMNMGGMGDMLKGMRGR
jgi:hypothetical protein